FSEDRPLVDGLPPALIADFLRERGADVVGVNCAEGPALVFEAAREMIGLGRPVSVQPNAGRPRRLDERTLYMTTPEYFGVYARRFFQSGAQLVGGCCGTGPEHIRRVAAAAAMVGGGRVKVEAATGAVPAAEIRRRPGSDVVNIADGRRAAARMSNLALGLRMQSMVPIDVILHVCCRDRNLLGLHSDLLGAWVLGIRNLVIITGDPPKMGDYPAA